MHDAAMTMRFLMVAAGIDGALAVGLGAFGAHGLKAKLEAAGTAELWRTAAHYQFVHVLALLALAALVARLGPQRPATLAASLWLGGSVLFCGSIYALALGAPTATGIITPFGGVAFIVGWLALCWLRDTSGATAKERN